VDAIFLEGSEPSFTEYNLNVSHRISFEDLLKKRVMCLCIFTPSNQTQLEIFKEYIAYFRGKNRAGVITIQNITLYIMPKVQEIEEISVLKSDQILGVFVDSNEINNRIDLQMYIKTLKQHDFNKDSKNEQIDFNMLNGKNQSLTYF